MNIKQIRNATIKLTYAGTTFLIDPWLAPQHSFSFASIPGKPFHVPDSMKEHILMPICPLPEGIKEILEGVDAYVVTHLHPDHFDLPTEPGASTPLDKEIPIFTQNEADASVLHQFGFKDVRVIKENGTAFMGVSLIKTPALHGTIEPCGEACGIIFSPASQKKDTEEKKLYLSGDTIWCSGVKETIRKYSPDVIILNACAAEIIEYGRLIMNDEDVECVAKAAPNAQIIISHMDNVAHASISRYEMRGRLARRRINGYLMPEDGEEIKI